MLSFFNYRNVLSTAIKTDGLLMGILNQCYMIWLLGLRSVYYDKSLFYELYEDALEAYNLQCIFQGDIAVFLKQITSEIFILLEVYNRENQTTQFIQLSKVIKYSFE